MTAQIHVWSDYVPRPAPTLRPEDPYLPDIWRRAVCPMARRHEVPMRLPTISPQPRTELAFRGAQYALDHGRAEVYHRQVMTAFFRENLDIGDRAAALDDEMYAERHRQALTESARKNITVVPTIIIGSRRIEGVATEDVLRQALHETAAA